MKVLLAAGVINPMRLAANEQQAISRVLHEVFGKDAEVIVFGSRADDRARGGDIDLYVETNLPSEGLFHKEIEALRRLEQEIGEQKVDLLVRSRKDAMQAIHRIAKETGVPLQ